MRAAWPAVAIALALTSAPASARADEPHPWTVAALYAEGSSITWEPRVQNTAGAIPELRVGYGLRPWLIPDLGLALNAFPDQVFELRPGVRLRPAGIPYLQAAFARLAVHGLLSVDGFDVSPDLEVGAMLETGRIFMYLAGQAGVYVRNPRVTLGARVGFGARF